MTLIEIDTNVRKHFKKSAKVRVFDPRKRVKFVHRMLGGVCTDCGKRGKKVKWNVHHMFYPYGYDENWGWKWRRCTEEEFWFIYFPEIMEACILLCRKCHRKRHGLK